MAYETDTEVVCETFRKKCFKMLMQKEPPLLLHSAGLDIDMRAGTTRAPLSYERRNHPVR